MQKGKCKVASGTRKEERVKLKEEGEKRKKSEEVGKNEEQWKILERGTMKEERGKKEKEKERRARKEERGLSSDLERSWSQSLQKLLRSIGTICKLRHFVDINAKH